MRCSCAYLSTDSRRWKPGGSCRPAGFSFLPSSPWDSQGAKCINVRQAEGGLSLVLPLAFSWFWKWLKYEGCFEHSLYIHVHAGGWCHESIQGLSFQDAPSLHLHSSPTSSSSSPWPPPLEVTSSLIAAATPDFWHTGGVIPKQFQREHTSKELSVQLLPHCLSFLDSKKLSFPFCEAGDLSFLTSGTSWGWMTDMSDSLALEVLQELGFFSDNSFWSNFSMLCGFKNNIGLR